MVETAYRLLSDLPCPVLQGQVIVSCHLVEWLEAADSRQMTDYLREVSNHGEQTGVLE